MSALTTEDPAREAHLQAVLRAVADMRENLGDRRQLSDLANAGLYSPWHFHRVFHQVTRTTPARFLAALRMERAKLALAQTDDTVTSISSRVGYESLGTFTSQFGRLVGLPPGAFRRLVDTTATLDIRPSLGVAVHDDDSGPRVELRPPRDEAPQVGAVLGLFRADLPQGPPVTFAALDEALRGRLHACPAPGTYDIFVLTLPSGTRLVDLALGTTRGARVGHVRTRLGGPVDGSAPIVVDVRPPLHVDPPVVSAAAAIHLSRMAT